jgi:Tol biopolymer transport system component
MTRILIGFGFVIVFLTGLTGIALAVGQGLPRATLAFVTYRRINPQIYLTDIDHLLVENLTGEDSYNAAPAWSPDGQWIAFLSNRDGTIQVYLMDSTGHRLHRLTSEQHDFTAPRFSADGQRVLFSTFSNRNEVFYSVNLDGGDLRDITPAANGQQRVADVDTFNTVHPPSPDGTRALRLGYADRHWSIYIEEGLETHLVADLGRDFIEPPVWSPDGLRIAFVSDRDGAADLYVADANDTSRRAIQRVTYDPAFDSSLAWQP